MEYLGIIAGVLCAGLIGGGLVQWLTLRLAQFRPTYGSCFLAAFAAFLVTALLYVLMLRLGPLAGGENAAAALFVANLAGILFHAWFYRVFVHGSDGQRLRLAYAIGAAFLLMTIGLGFVLLLGWVLAVATGMDLLGT